MIAPNRSTVLNALVALVSIVVTLAAAEVAVRLFRTEPPRFMDAFNLQTSPYYRADSELGWVPRPAVQGEHNLAGSFSSTFRTNSIGLRDREFTPEDLAARHRTVVIGDSFTWGWGVNDGEIFVDGLEEQDTRAEYINLGVTAYGLEQEIEYFKRVGLDFDPHRLLVAFVQNDVYAGSRPEAAAPDAAVPRDRPSGLAAVKQYLATNLALYRLLTDAIRGSPALSHLATSIGLADEPGGFETLDPNIGTALKTYPDELTNGWEHVFEGFRELRRLGESHGFDVVIALVPARQSVDRDSLERTIRHTRYERADFDPEKPYRLIEEFGAAEGIEVINPLDAFIAAHESGRELYLRADMHFNAAGHALFAREIARGLGIPEL